MFLFVCVCVCVCIVGVGVGEYGTCVHVNAIPGSQGQVPGNKVLCIEGTIVTKIIRTFQEVRTPIFIRTVTCMLLCKLGSSMNIALLSLCA